MKVFERYELEAYLGDSIADFDVDAIIDEATTVDYRTGNRVWRDMEPGELEEIAQRHDVSGK